MLINRISADEAQSTRRDHLRTGPDGRELLLKLASAPTTWNGAKRSARFVMTSQSRDHYGDIVITAGVETDVFESNPKAFLNHMSGDWPIGNWANIEKQLRGRPPRMEGDLVLLPAHGPVQQVDMAAWMIEHGGLQACSIGFLPNWGAIEKVLEEDGSWKGGLQYNECTLVECSLCGVPANQDALAKMVGDGAKFAKETIERVLDEWQKSPEGALMSRSDFEKAYKIVGTEVDRIESVDELIAIAAEQAIDELVERQLTSQNRVAITRERLTAFERTERQRRLADARQRDLDIIRARGS